jgi:hypothetical protein
MMGFRDAERYCLERSVRLRLRPADSRWLIRLAVEQLSEGPYVQGDECALHAKLTAVLWERVRDRYGNPVAVWVLLNIVVPAVIRLVLEWWLHRREA